MVTNVGVAVEIGSQAQPVQFLFPFLVLVDAILILVVDQCLAMSGDVGSSIFESGMAENMGVEVEVVAPSVTGQKLFLLPV